MPATTISNSYAIARSWRSVTQSLGKPVVAAFGGTSQILAVIAGVLYLAIQPLTWTRPVRAVFARQMLFTAVDGIWVAARIASAVGVLLIVQAAMWTDSFGSNMESVSELIVRITVRDLAPMIACLVVIGRSGIAMATELASMKVNREIEVLSSQGIDITKYVVLPRVLSAMIATLLLAVIVVLTMFVCGYVIGIVMNIIRESFATYFDDIVQHIHSADLVFFLPKTLLSGALIGAISCLKGLQVRGSASEVPQIASRAGVAALTAVFMVAAALSLVIYGRLLVLQVL